MAFNVKPLGLRAREPVTLAELKAHLTIDSSFTADDATLSDMLAGARQAAEDLLGKTLVPRRWLFARDSFPVFRHLDQAPSRTDYDALGNYNFTGIRWNDSQTIILPQPPLLSVDALRYADLDGSWQLLDPAAYQADTISQPGRVLPASGAYWPQTAPVANAVQVEFTAGFAQDIAAETVFVPTDAPYTVMLEQAALYCQLLKLTDVETGDPVPAGQYAAGSEGRILFASALAGKALAVDYRVVDIPANCKMAIKLRAATFYANREEYVAGSAAAEVPTWFEDLLEQGTGRSNLFGYRA